MTTPRLTTPRLQDVDALLTASRVIVCCGSGGVGKTTVAASMALRAAGLGRRAVVITIDPAKRLADALGLDALRNTPTPVQLDQQHDHRGTLHACMLDTKATFDALVHSEANSGDQARRILENRFYRNISASLGGTQEYMASERVHELTTSGEFDLVVVDTPPTRNALDFLTAPARLTRLLDNRVFRVLMLPSRGGLRFVGNAAQVMLRSVGKALGGDVMADAIAFFQAFEGMEEGFRRRATEVSALLRSGESSWVLVTSARDDALAEAAWFADRVGDLGVRIRLLVANRMTPLTVGLPPGPCIDSDSDPARAPILAVLAAARVLARQALEQDAALAPVVKRLGGIPVLRIPLRPVDVHDLASLRSMLA